jgi:general secretion pathway protein K
MKKHRPHLNRSKREGAALLVALWVLIILSLIVGSFAFEMKLEATLVSYEKKRFKAESLALSGMEYAEAILDKRSSAKQLEVEDRAAEDDGFMMAALQVKKGLTAQIPLEIGEGKVTIQIAPAETKKNVNLMSREEWLDLFEYCLVPPDEWDFLLDCLLDWMDENDLHRINGAESDDPFYQERGYPCKNAPLDSVEELSLIKGWNDDILYGRAGKGSLSAIQGVAEHLTVWGDGKININSVTRSQLEALTDLDSSMMDQFFEDRKGADAIEGTADDGFTAIPHYLNGNIFKLNTTYVKVTSTADIHGIKYEINAIYLLKDKNSMPVYWEEGPAK